MVTVRPGYRRLRKAERARLRLFGVPCEAHSVTLAKVVRLTHNYIPGVRLIHIYIPSVRLTHIYISSVRFTHIYIHFSHFHLGPNIYPILTFAW